MVMSFSTALWSSAQIESQSELPSRSPSFLWKKQEFLGQIFTSGTPYQFLGLDSAFSKRHTSGVGARISRPGSHRAWLYSFPYLNIKKSLSFVSLFLSKEKGFDQCHIHSLGYFRLLFGSFPDYCSVARSIWVNLIELWLKLLISVNLLLQ